MSITINTNFRKILKIQIQINTEYLLISEKESNVIMKKKEKKQVTWLEIELQLPGQRSSAVLPTLAG